MKKVLLASLSVLALTSTMALAETQQSGITAPVNVGTNATGEVVSSDMTVARNEAEFRSQLMALGGLSLAQSELALTKATDPRVIDFAKAEVAEQQGIAAQLKARGTLMQPLSADAQKTMDKLTNAAKGKSFDEAYLAEQVTGHEKLDALINSLLNKAPPSGAPKEEEEVRAMAKGAQPTVKQHLDTSKKLLATK